VPEPAAADAPELAILIGFPGSGKSTFYAQRLAATHAHVSKDVMPRSADKRARQCRLLEAALGRGRSAAVDNVNATRAAARGLIASVTYLACRVARRARTTCARFARSARFVVDAAAAASVTMPQEEIDMLKHAFVTVGMVLGFASVALGQAADTPFQVRAIASLKSKDAIVVSNDGASSTVASPQNGRACVNTYAFASDSGQLLDCCACPVPANAQFSIAIISDLLENPKPKPKSVVLKLMASTGTAGVCNPTTVATGSNVLMTGMVAWKGETPFTPATLSAAELSAILNQCTTKQPSGRICSSCVLPAG
jgi:hypothetical protein